MSRLSPVALGLCLTLSSACKPRSASDVQFVEGLPSELDLSKEDAATVAAICSQKQLVVFVGNGEGLGPLVFTDQGRQAFGENLIQLWRTAERKREVSYFASIKAEFAKLVTALARREAACLDARVAAAWRDPAFAAGAQAEARLGNTTLIGILDGPNSDASDPPNTVVQSWHFGFEQHGDQWDWQVYGPNYWLASGSPDPHLMSTADEGFVYAPLLKLQVVDPKTAPQASDRKYTTADIDAGPAPSQEQFISQLVISVTKQAGDVAKLYFNDARPISETTYIFKSHGAVVQQDLALDALPLPELPFAEFQPNAHSAFLFDVNGPGRSYRALDGKTISTPKDLVGMTRFFAPLWSPAKICHTVGLYEPQATPANEAACIAAIKASAVAAAAAPDGYAPEQLDMPAATQGQIDRNQGQLDRGGDQGAIDRGGDQGAIDRGGDQDLGGLTLGDGIWNKHAQSGKGIVFDPSVFNRQPSKVDRANAEWRKAVPDAFRLLGNGQEINTPQDGVGAILLGVGSRLPSLVMFDTCHGNLFGNPMLSDTAPNMTEASVMPLRYAATSNPYIAAIANPGPVRIDAVNYGVLNGFQLSLLAEKQANIAAYLQQNKAPDAAATTRFEKDLATIRSLHKDDTRAKPDSVSDAAHYKLYAAVFDCNDKKATCPVGAVLQTGQRLDQIRQTIAELRKELARLKAGGASYMPTRLLYSHAGMKTLGDLIWAEEIFNMLADKRFSDPTMPPATPDLAERTNETLLFGTSAIEAMEGDMRGVGLIVKDALHVQTLSPAVASLAGRLDAYLQGLDLAVADAKPETQLANALFAPAITRIGIAALTMHVNAWAALWSKSTTASTSSLMAQDALAIRASLLANLQRPVLGTMAPGEMDSLRHALEALEAPLSKGDWLAAQKILAAVAMAP